ncbi:hypothetical protein FKW77_003099 [Venturia effusa]|uniref:GED domain-containing protein n=1 Tax=Venturia effusa TaxID=50376 RepID=A0A517LDN5_9PEZI|nr:hypothetical protein FKW77_003099 [Venturia effusa]
MSLPRLASCGDQSVGKSAVLEAITGIPFPKDDGVCTRHATEINSRIGPINKATATLRPDTHRRPATQTRKKAWKETITDFEQLPKLIEAAMEAMELTDVGKGRTFSRDVLSIDIEGPSRPQLSLVDLPGLIQNESKRVSAEDVKVAEAITDHYISQPRTICLAIICATTDYANQGIIAKLQKVDPLGQRTLGIITKPDRVEQNSRNERNFINLALNKDIMFKLGWHVLKNRDHEENLRKCSLEERNRSEATFFEKSNWKHVDEDKRGIQALSDRIRKILFSHIKQELPNVQAEIDADLETIEEQVEKLGASRSTAGECRSFLTKLSQDCHSLSKAAIDGFYEGQYFASSGDTVSGSAPTSRLRAKIHKTNEEFVEEFRENAATYKILDDEAGPIQSTNGGKPNRKGGVRTSISKTREDALKWTKSELIQIRGRELSGNYNPLVIGHLFWEQSKHWDVFAKAHIAKVAAICKNFLSDLFQKKFPEDVKVRLWREQIDKALKTRQTNAEDELKKLIKDKSKHPINYNGSYTEAVEANRLKRKRDHISSLAETSYVYSDNGTRIPGAADVEMILSKLMRPYNGADKMDIDRHACEDTLDCLLAIYPVILETFTYNVVAQAVERHLVDDIEEIFSPVSVSQMSDKEILAIAKEPEGIKTEREFLQGRLENLQQMRSIVEEALIEPF